MARVLVIDDEDSVRALLSRILVREGHQVSEATGGRQGMALLKARGADLVITDISMPDSDGLEVLIAARCTQPAPRVIVIAGEEELPQLNVMRMARLLGAFATLFKPFHVEDMLDLVKQALLA